jgi:23S rRNA pseudouridine2605 synthase
MALVRLQKFLSECGVASRRKAEELIVSKKVKVNGRIVSELGTKIDPTTDRVQVKERYVSMVERGVILLNKPKGVVSTLSDPEGRPTIADFLTKHFKSYFPVGRLDWESTGLMVLTNDGEMAERLLHPRYGFERTYHVKVSGRVEEKTLRRIERGINLEDGPVQAKGAILETLDDATWLEITVTVGKNRVVRRMMDAVHHPVQKLQRVSHGPFKLGKLKPGEMRRLSEKEYLFFRQRVLGDDAAPAPTAAPAESLRNERRLSSSDRRSHPPTAGGARKFPKKRKGRTRLH